MKVDREGDDWIVVDDAGILKGRFGSSSAAWRYADRCSGEPISPAEKKSEWIAAKILGAPGPGTTPASRSTGRRRQEPLNNEAWTWPEGLSPLRDWLAARHVDVRSIKSARQALWMAISLGKLKMRMPGKREDAFPALLVAQGKLCGFARPKVAPASAIVTREHGLGTFGPASEVRRIDPSSYKIGGQV